VTACVEVEASEDDRPCSQQVDHDPRSWPGTVHRQIPL